MDGAGSSERKVCLVGPLQFRLVFNQIKPDLFLEVDHLNYLFIIHGNGRNWATYKKDLCDPKLVKCTHHVVTMGTGSRRATIHSGVWSKTIVINDQITVLAGS